jgi:hypothetical protein
MAYYIEIQEYSYQAWFFIVTTTGLQQVKRL